MERQSFFYYDRVRWRVEGHTLRQYLPCHVCSSHWGQGLGAEGLRDALLERAEAQRPLEMPKFNYKKQRGSLFHLLLY